MYPFLEHLLHAHFSAMLCQVCLVANEYYRDLKVVHLIVALGINEVVTPGSDALVAFHVRQIENNHAAICPTVKSVTQALKPFLPSGIPNLERDLFSVLKGDDLFHKVSTYRRSLNLVDLFVLEIFNKSCFSNVRITNDNHFQKGCFPVTGSQRSCSGRICIVSTSIRLLLGLSKLLKLVFVTVVGVAR